MMISSLLECCSFALLSNDAVEECTTLKFTNDEVPEEFDITNLEIMISNYRLA